MLLFNFKAGHLKKFGSEYSENTTEALKWIHLHIIFISHKTTKNKSHSHKDEFCFMFMLAKKEMLPVSS